MTQDPPPGRVIVAAMSQAMLSPCAKSKRGAAIFDSATMGDPDPLIWGQGFNGPPQGRSCTGTEHCHRVCRQICAHAEARALRQALMAGPSFPPLELVHVKVRTTGPGSCTLVAGGGPSCWQCSCALLDSGIIAAVWLWERRGIFGEEGEWSRYPIDEFHISTLWTNRLREDE